jgi:hypothetical protein
MAFFEGYITQDIERHTRSLRLTLVKQGKVKVYLADFAGKLIKYINFY